MNFLLTSNPAFLVIPAEDNEFIFYNSLQHRASRLNYLEMLILDMYYTFQDKTYIIDQFNEDRRPVISEALDKIDEHKLLVCEDIPDTMSSDPVFPSSYYLHLTYKCNLRCTYCYNKTIRKDKQSHLPLKEWMLIIDKIAPYVKTITLTGGEFFLYPDLLKLLKYVKHKCPDAVISAISNGMHDFWEGDFSEAFEYISSISFSCDSISREGERKGFDPELYRKNILWVKEAYPHVRISVASTVTSSNLPDIKEISGFCQEHQFDLSRTMMNPENAKEVCLMPSMEDQMILSDSDIPANSTARLKSASFRCGAGKSVCSIDPSGNIYPCQSLHYDEFLMGNLVRDSIKDLKYFGKKGFILKTVNEFPMCSKCKVKYICGGGCPATAYRFYGNRIGPNHLSCRMNYNNSIQQLKALNNRL